MAIETILQNVPVRQESQIRADGRVAYVQLNRGFEAIIDTADVAMVRNIRWRAWVGSHGHAYAIGYISGKQVFMHRLLLSAERGQFVDHADGDGLNNRRANIRICTASQNMANKAVCRRNKLRAKGVSIDSHARCRPYRASIKPNGKTIHLGRYATVEEASAAYRGASIALFGKFSRTE